VKSLRIAVDPRLDERHGPEIHWAWRQMLTGIGWTWEAVSPDTACEVAFVVDPAHAPAAGLCIQANPEAWAQPASRRWQSVAHDHSLAHPVFEGEDATPCPIRRDGEQIICERDLLFDVFWLATGQHERHLPQDRHGFFTLDGAAASSRQAQHQALATQIGVWLEEILRQQGCPPPLPPWPDGRRAAACAGHDVDYPEVIRWLEPLRILMRQGWKGLGPALEVGVGRRNHWSFANWIALERHLHTRSAFYFVARKGSLWEYATGTPDPFYDVTSPRFRQLFGYLKDEGWEIGLHASYLAYQSREKFAAEKQRLEAASGQAVTGNRHHYWHLNPRDPEDTLWLHEQIGLAYDSSLIHDRHLGWRRGSSQPFYPFYQRERRELRTLQLPVAWMDAQLFTDRAHNPGDRLALLSGLADRTAAQRGCLVIDIHEYVFDDVLYPGWTDTFRRLWEYLAARGDVWFATPGQVAEHWRARYAALVQASRGLDKGRA
jgi:hypothetical protein